MNSEVLKEILRGNGMIEFRRNFRLLFKTLLKADAPPETLNAWLMNEISKSSRYDTELLFPDIVSPDPPRDILGNSVFSKYVSRSIAVALPLKEALKNLEISTRNLWAQAVTQLAEDFGYYSKINFQVKCFSVIESECSLELTIEGNDPAIAHLTRNKNHRYSLTLSYLEKLREMYNGDEEEFETRVWLLLHRYDSLLGPRGRGWQLSVPELFMEEISRSTGVTPCEAFASPLNARHKFFSLFRDTDKFFGSLGNLFWATETTMPELIEVNPPFELNLMRRCIGFFLKILEKREGKGEKFQVIFILPNWPKTVEKIMVSQYLYKKTLLKRGEHRYENGFQHEINSSQKLPFWGECDTLIAFLKTAASPELSLTSSEISTSWM